MTRFLRDFFAQPGASRTVILLGPHASGAPRQYDVRPRQVVVGAAVAALALAAVVVAAVLLTPLRGGPDAAPEGG